ncbi:M15 family metallopeptidase, partial [Kitasatospora cinereorecta]
LTAKGIDPALAKPKAKKVTWTLNSNHFKKASGYGHAIDIVPFPVDWDDPKKFDAIAKAFKTAAAQAGVKITWGGDWNTPDRPHFELTS